MLSVGDTNQVFLHNISGGSTVTFQRIATYTAGMDANFSTAFSPSGVKFAVACQDGSVTVWDVRSSIPLAKYRTALLTSPKTCVVRSRRNGPWMWDEPSSPCPPYSPSTMTPRALGGPARALKFSPLGADRELLVFTAVCVFSISQSSCLWSDRLNFSTPIIFISSMHEPLPTIR
jgi:WD40 repeat protein